tara:strand:+ start:4446 stop:4577 length:132 start_codon:yes stop_codon:yes gene_type:complete
MDADECSQICAKHVLIAFNVEFRMAVVVGLLGCINEDCRPKEA